MKKITILAALAPAGLFVVFPPLFPNPAITGVAVFVLIFAVAAMGWNIFCSYSGYISLGHAAFYGIGAYILALMCQIWHIPGGIIPFFLLPLVGLLTGFFATGKIRKIARLFRASYTASSRRLALPPLQ